MTEQTIAQRTNNILVELFELEGEELTPESSLYEELGLDSLDSVDLIVALEKEFGFKVVRSVDEEKIRAIRLLKDLYGFIEEKINQG
ncbi:MAG: acyl carrier protein [Deltaproteobacteria bacterium]|nr:acyl carrier protein [Deltaproteobacteria bacterium]